MRVIHRQFSSPPSLSSEGCQMAKFDPFLSLDCVPTPSTLAQSKERDQILPSGNLATRDLATVVKGYCIMEPVVRKDFLRNMDAEQR